MEIEILKRFGITGSGKPEPLQQHGMKLLQYRQFLLGLHALTAHPDLTGVGQLQHVAQQAIVIGAVLDVADEASVDLDLINVHLLETAQTGVSGAEIIHRDLDPLPLPLAEDLVEIGIVLQLHALCDLNGQRIPGKAALPHCLAHILHHTGLAQLGVGHIDADAELRHIGRLPALGQGSPGPNAPSDRSVWSAPEWGQIPAERHRPAGESGSAAALPRREADNCGKKPGAGRPGRTPRIHSGTLC